MTSNSSWKSWSTPASWTELRPSHSHPSTIPFRSGPSSTPTWAPGSRDTITKKGLKLSTSVPVMIYRHPLCMHYSCDLNHKLKLKSSVARRWAGSDWKKFFSFHARLMEIRRHLMRRIHIFYKLTQREEKVLNFHPAAPTLDGRTFSQVRLVHGGFAFNCPGGIISVPPRCDERKFAASAAVSIPSDDYP